MCLLGPLILGATAHAAEYHTKHDESDQLRGEPEEGHALVYIFRTGLMGALKESWLFLRCLRESLARHAGFARVVVRLAPNRRDLPLYPSVHRSRDLA